MLKKIVCLIIAVVMGCTVLAGCNLVTFDSESDDRKVAITIASYDITSPDGTQTYTTEEEKIYKSNFRSVYNYYGSYYEYYYGKEKAKQYIVEELATERIVLNLADAYLSFGYITLGNYEKNQIAQSVYSAIDDAITTAKNGILEDRGVTVTDDATDEEETAQTTYPVKEENGDVYGNMKREELLELCQARGLVEVPAAGDDAAQDAVDKITARQLKNKLVQDDRKDIELWTPSLSRYPGLNTYDEDTRSLELQAFEKALKNIKEAVFGIFDLSEADKKAVEDEYKQFDEITNTKGLSYVYGALRDTKTAYLYAGESYESQVKMNLIEEYITGTVEVTKSDVETIYKRTLEEQKLSFANVANYEKALSEGTTDFLYFADANHFFVKHILVPFSDAQTAALTAFKNSVECAVEGGYEDYRARLADEIMSYVHVDGEDFGEPISIDEIYEDIASQVNGAATLYEKERLFDDLIYKYNTDPGIFGSTYGYMEKYDLEGGTESYVPEFADAARALYDGGVEGALTGKVVTDYGVHILYLSKMPKAGEVIGLNDYYTYAGYNSVYGKMEETALTEKENAAFSTWRTEQIARYYKGDENNPSVVKVNQKVVDSVNA